jgi:hypothetical protein
MRQMQRSPLLLLLLLAACSSAVPSNKANSAAISATENNAMNTEPAPASDGIIRASGRIQYQDLEGGFWGIVADDGRKFDPIELDEKFHKDGLRVIFEAEPDTDRMSTRMWGSLVVLKKIELEK